MYIIACVFEKDADLLEKAYGGNHFAVNLLEEPYGFIPSNRAYFEDFGKHRLIAYIGNDKNFLKDLKEKALFYAELKEEGRAKYLYSALAYLCSSYFKEEVPVSKIMKKLLWVCEEAHAQALKIDPNMPVYI
ncbi:hypothetical protein [Thermoanaerobacterium thermosaccharolyticum]|uniref:hypothetical protein n=1 Tax=Thermoanaerobacterium thermosaccharolyticum TaxID=1517 RepID=UPI003DA91C8E